MVAETQNTVNVAAVESPFLSREERIRAWVRMQTPAVVKTALEGEHWKRVWSDLGEIPAPSSDTFDAPNERANLLHLLEGGYEALAPLFGYAEPSVSFGEYSAATPPEVVPDHLIVSTYTLNREFAAFLHHRVPGSNPEDAEWSDLFEIIAHMRTLAAAAYSTGAPFFCSIARTAVHDALSFLSDLEDKAIALAERIEIDVAARRRRAREAALRPVLRDTYARLFPYFLAAQSTLLDDAGVDVPGFDFVAMSSDAAAFTATLAAAWDEMEADVLAYPRGEKAYGGDRWWMYFQRLGPLFEFWQEGYGVYSAELRAGLFTLRDQLAGAQERLADVDMTDAALEAAIQ